MLRNPVLEMGYYNTYYYANVINNVLFEPFAYLRDISEFFENDNYLNFITPYPKYTALHMFSEYVIEQSFSEDLSSDHIQQILVSSDKKLPINRAMDHYNIEYLQLNEWATIINKEIAQITEDDICDYYYEIRLNESFEQLIAHTTDEVFFVMFLNRDALQKLNDIISRYIRDIDHDSLPIEMRKYLETDGVLKRPYMPEWVRRAVFYRDRGMCAICHRDLTGIVNISSNDNFDHIIPLAQSGINDVTNIQLLCDECNKRKGDRILTISNAHERWYSLD